MRGESRWVIGEDASAALGACAADIEPRCDAAFAEDVLAGQADRVVALGSFGLVVVRGILRFGESVLTDWAGFVLD